MLAHLLSLVIVNTYSWFGGQGYCAYEFALSEEATEYSNLEIVMRPQFNPQETATGNAELPDATLSLESIGGSSANGQQKVSIEADCSVTGFEIVTATATVDGRPADLLQDNAVTIETYRALPLTIGTSR